MITSFRLLEKAPQGLNFDWIKPNPVEDALRALEGSDEDAVLEFDLLSGVKSVIKRTANRLEIGVKFAESAEKLYVKIAPLAQQKPRRQSAPKPEAGKPTLSISAAIRQSVSESQRTTAEICDRVEVLLPGTKKASVSALLWQMESAGKLVKRGLFWYRTEAS